MLLKVRNCYFSCQKISKFSKTCFTTTKGTALAPFNVVHTVVKFSWVFRSALNKIPRLHCYERSFAVCTWRCWKPISVRKTQ